MIIGIAQALTIFLEISRSGSNLAIRILKDLNRELQPILVFYYLFLLVGATIVQFKDIGAGLSADLWPFIIA